MPACVDIVYQTTRGKKMRGQGQGRGRRVGIVENGNRILILEGVRVSLSMDGRIIIQVELMWDRCRFVYLSNL